MSSTVRFKARIRLFQKKDVEKRGRVHPALSGYMPQINFQDHLFACRIESAENTISLEQEYDVLITLPRGKDYPHEWFRPGGRFQLNEAANVVGEGVILGDICVDDD